jgi:hypothetical protein
MNTFSPFKVLANIMTDSSIVAFGYATKTQDIGFVVGNPSQPDAFRLHLTPVN